jgi:hypothetical protein
MTQEIELFATHYIWGCNYPLNMVFASILKCNSKLFNIIF